MMTSRSVVEKVLDMCCWSEGEIEGERSEGVGLACFVGVSVANSCSRLCKGAEGTEEVAVVVVESAVLARRGSDGGTPRLKKDKAR